MNLTDAGNTQGIVIDLTVLLGYEIKLNIDYTDDSVINYWQAVKGNKIINADDPEELWGLAAIIEIEPEGEYYKTAYLEKIALKYAIHLGYKVRYNKKDYVAVKAGSPFDSIFGRNPFTLLSMIGIAEQYGAQWNQYINVKKLDAVMEEACFEMPVENVFYINGRGFVLGGKVKEGRVYRGTHVRIVACDGKTKFPKLIVDDLPIFGYIECAEKGDYAALSFFSSHKTEELQQMYPIERGDIVLYANIS